MHKFVAIAVGFLCCLAPAAALAAFNYTLVVPVSAKQLPAGSSIQVVCPLYPGPNGSGGQPLAIAQSPIVNVGAGSIYIGNMSAIASIATPAASYKCSLLVYQNGVAVNFSADTVGSVMGSGQGALATGWHGAIQTGATNF